MRGVECRICESPAIRRRFYESTPMSTSLADGLPIRLRDVEPLDLPVFYKHQSEPEANRLAATYPRSSEAFHAHWTAVLESPNLVVRSILLEESLAGYICCFKCEYQSLVGYWLGREYWGRGIATRALKLLMAEVPDRPLYARVAVTNGASLRVLEKCGFQVVDYQYAPGDEHFAESEEAILELTH